MISDLIAIAAIAIIGFGLALTLIVHELRLHRSRKGKDEGD